MQSSPGRRFGSLLADAYEKQQAAKQPEPALPPAPELQPKERDDATGDTFQLASDSRTDTHLLDLRLSTDDDLEWLDEELVADDRAPGRPRGPRLAFVGAAVLALVLGDGSFLPHVDFASWIPAQDEITSLTARRLDGVPIELIRGGRSRKISRLVLASPDDAKSVEAPTIRSMSVSSLVPASAPASTTAAAPSPLDASTVQHEDDAVRPAASSVAAVPATRTPAADVEALARPATQSAAAAPAVVASSALDEQSVRTALQRYRTAYERLDAKSASTVWPSVNEPALARAFGSLQSQTLTFTTCDVDFRGADAVVTCDGSTRYTPLYGSREPRVEPRIWTFTLRKRGTEWKIDSVKAER